MGVWVSQIFHLKCTLVGHIFDLTCTLVGHFPCNSCYRKRIFGQFFISKVGGLGGGGGGGILIGKLYVI